MLNEERRPTMEYFAGLDVSMEETYICVVDREGVVVHETKVASTA
jgi:transposase